MCIARSSLARVVLLCLLCLLWNQMEQAIDSNSDPLLRFAKLIDSSCTMKRLQTDNIRNFLGTFEVV